MVGPGVSSFPRRQVLCIPLTRPCPRCSMRGEDSHKKRSESPRVVRMLSRIKETQLGENVVPLDGVVKEGLRAEVILEERSSWEKKSWSVQSPSVLSIFLLPVSACQPVSSTVPKETHT